MAHENVDSQVSTFPPQVDPDQLTGLVGKGEFLIHTAMKIVGLFASSDLPLDWQVEVELPDLAGGVPQVYLWLAATAKVSVLNNDPWILPKGAIVRVSTNNVLASNPRCQMVFHRYFVRDR